MSSRLARGEATRREEGRETLPAQGLFRGRTVARRFESPDGFIVLVGKTAADNDDLSLRLARPADFWLHAASGAGSHVLVLNDSGVDRLPRATRDFAAALAARYSKSRAGGRVAVHLARGCDISKPRGAPPGRVALRRSETVFARPAAFGRVDDA